MKLFDLAKIIRSKNAGPLYITFDLMFDSRENMEKVVSALTKEQISAAYDVPVEQIDIIPYDCVDSVKITFPRRHVSGSLEDDDVYGCQQHMPLAQIELA
ncbi:MAG: DUF4387 domain-containing protein [Oscillospiraceae bacterium]|nr:DUF4387 domain-containing protein [Oscillospiraceae bacterium]MBR2366163.1 DUF4387 domain-containing protein [Oscillospiraceae bacterium]MBR2977225.1 DUF4387 domain-containing protein [Oscillospiraceae bacterium]MBR3849101.1 DUF4387 domain-containing protein [Oscillospiraceae bacterium]